jgi:HTH-type transcriptional regulator/antitoxin HigA
MAARSGKSATIAVSATYLKLVRGFPLRPIRTDEELDRAIDVINSLLDRNDLDPAEADYLDVLGDLVERYETEQHPIEDVSDADLLAHLIDAKGVTQAQVARGAGIAVSTISEVLSGKRTLSRTHIGKLARYFGVDPGVFSFRNDLGWSGSGGNRRRCVDPGVFSVGND